MKLTTEIVIEDYKKDESIDHAWKTLNKKLRKNSYFHIALNLTLFLLIAILVVLNLWGMKTNFKLKWISKIFLAIAIITAISGLISSVISIFRFKSRSTEIKTAINQIKLEYDHYQKGVEPYNTKSKDKILLKTVAEISYIPR